MLEAPPIEGGGSRPTGGTGSRPGGPDRRTWYPPSADPKRLDADGAARPVLGVGRFLLERCIGAGAFGHVWRARDRDRGVAVAVKLVRTDVAEEERTALLHEAQAVARLDHPAIVRVLGLGTVSCAEAGDSSGYLEENTPWLAMDLLDYW